eukprot:7762744-Pyramimonas_sp.AAC.1
MSWLLAPAVGPALEQGLGARSRASGGAAYASGGGAAGSARTGGACPYPDMSRLVLAVVLLTARIFPMVVFLIIPPATLGISVM